MKVLGIIPARGGSKGIPNKNILPLGNKPLISYMIETAKKCSSLTHCVVSTDSEDIAKTAKEYGAEVPFLRPHEFAQDDSTLMEVKQHAVNYFQDQGETFDAVISLQPTAPFLKAETIEKSIQMLKTERCDSVTSIATVTQAHPHIIKKFDDDGKIENYFEISDRGMFKSRQCRTPVYYLTGSFYLRPIDLLMEHKGGGHALGDDARACLLDEIEATDINTPLDFTIAECLLAKGLI